MPPQLKTEMQTLIDNAGGNMQVAYNEQLCSKPDCYFCAQMFRVHILSKPVDVKKDGWIPYQIRYLKLHWNNQSLRVISNRLNKPIWQLRKRADILELGRKPRTNNV